jgi:hypothetical protein
MYNAALWDTIILHGLCIAAFVTGTGGMLTGLLALRRGKQEDK